MTFTYSPVFETQNKEHLIVSIIYNTIYLGPSLGSDGKESACSAGDQGSIPGLRRSPGEGNDNPLWCSCLKDSMDRVAWWQAIVRGVTKSQTWLSN